MGCQEEKMIILFWIAVGFILGMTADVILGIYKVRKYHDLTKDRFND